MASACARGDARGARCSSKGLGTRLGAQCFMHRLWLSHGGRGLVSVTDLEGFPGMPTCMHMSMACRHPLLGFIVLAMPHRRTTRNPRASFLFTRAYIAAPRPTRPTQRGPDVPPVLTIAHALAALRSLYESGIRGKHEAEWCVGMEGLGGSGSVVAVAKRADGSSPCGPQLLPPTNGACAALLNKMSALFSISSSFRDCHGHLLNIAPTFSEDVNGILRVGHGGRRPGASNHMGGARLLLLNAQASRRVGKPQAMLAPAGGRWRKDCETHRPTDKPGAWRASRGARRLHGRARLSPGSGAQGNPHTKRHNGRAIAGGRRVEGGAEKWCCGRRWAVGRTGC